MSGGAAVSVAHAVLPDLVDIAHEKHVQGVLSERKSLTMLRYFKVVGVLGSGKIQMSVDRALSIKRPA